MALPASRPALTASRRAASRLPAAAARFLSTPDSSYRSQAVMPRDGAGRWSQTPPAMKAPMSVNTPKNEVNRVWLVNQDPDRLDAMYDRLLGPGGCELLPDELKWLAVTHKSFDYGRRGFNDRLALLGRLTLIMEATKDIVNQPALAKRVPNPGADSRLASVDNLSDKAPSDTASVQKLYRLADKMGMLNVMRWKPRLTRDLEQSGVQKVLSGALLAVVGAVVLQHGSVMASKIIRERILARLAKL